MSHAAETWTTLSAVRRESPLVHSITNYVAMDITANGLLAVGASPAMVHAVEEVEDFTSIAAALVINIGTLSPAWVDAMERAAGRAATLGKPWVLDPVGAGATPYRTRVARELARRRPTVIRGNASEVLALAEEGRAGKGVDSAHASEEARTVALALARELGCVVAVTGATDYVTDGEAVLAVANGHPLMARVTALGCTASALAGAFVAVSRDPLAATAHALAVLGLCGEIAARESPGPGTLRWRILDALHTLDEGAVREGARIS
ncbi:MAG TPA: hydroxyethylthiazole kinase [Longimicrobiaceae bacterium]|nr:hydroxyethylthiazole kinase [Longimicrobiaceae bacterium]